MPTPDPLDIDPLRQWATERLDQFYTDPARRLGASRWRFMETFFAEFRREIDSAGCR